VYRAHGMNPDSLDIRLLRFRSRREEPAQALATALLEASRFSEALEVVQIGQLESDDDPRLLVLEGRIWFEQGDLAKAQAVLLRVIKLRPIEKDGYRWLAQVLMKRGEPARAAQVLEKALAIDPNDKQLQQARQRAERPPAHSKAPLPEVPLPPPAVVRPANLPPLPAVPAPPPARSGIPQPSRAAPESLRARPAPVANDIAPTPVSASRSAQPIVSASRSAQPLAVAARAPQAPVDTLPDTIPPTPGAQAALVQMFDEDEDDSIDIHDVRTGDVFEQHGRRSGAEEEPTKAFEMPQEITDWLENERTGQVSAIPGARPVEPEHRVALRTPVVPISIVDEILSDAEAVRPSHEAVVKQRSVESETAPYPASMEISPSYGAEPLSSEAEIETEVFDQPASFEAVAPFEQDVPPSVDPEPPEQVLELLGKQGIFEQPAARNLETEWVSKREAPRAGNRLGTSLAVVWVLALGAAGGGYYGFTRWLEVRKADAKTLIADAVADARDGQYESLLAAERSLRKARDRDPKSIEAIEALLFVHAARALEDATGDVGYLRATVARAEQAKVAAPLLAAGKALIFAYDRKASEADAESKKALELGPHDARALYLMGRLAQRAGKPEAGALLSRATTQDPGLSLAWLAQAEIARQEGERERAAELLAKSLGDDQAQLRAELWSIVLGTGTEPNEALDARLSKLAPRIERGAASDKLLAGVARASVGLAKGDLEGARAAVKEAAKLRVMDPELMSLLGERAASVGEHDLAYRAANAAMLAAPSVRRYRDALANVLLKRGEGKAVLAALEGIDDSGAWMLLTRARAALLAGSREALEEAKKNLAAYRNSPEGKDDVDAGALLVRSDLRLGANPEALIAAARSLVQKAPSSAMAQLALGEVAVNAAQGELAVSALEKAKKLSPEDADVHTLLGRAYRLTGKPAQAEESLERALLLSPSHPGAREALGGLLLDRGEYGRALGLFSALERERGGLAATFGVVEARIGAGQLEEAQKTLDTLGGDAREVPAARVLDARLSLARGRPVDAARTLEPMVDEDAETRSADLLALYGDALYAADRVDSAAGAYEAALELDGSHPDALVGRAMAAVRAEKTAQALELLEQAKISLASRVRPARVKANLLLAEAKADILKESYSKAKEQLAVAITLPGAPAESFFWYGESLARTKTPGATDQYMKYLELEPHGFYADRAKKALAPR
jgi:tetratricopeptide (TPR) repeat protein